MNEFSDNKDMFSTFGSLRVSIAEAIDVFVEPYVKNRKPSGKRYKFFICVKICDHKGNEILKYNTTPQNFFVGEQIVPVGDEYIFDGVSSSNSLQISFHSIGEMDAKQQPIPTYCIGLTTIPISRLEENIQVPTLLPLHIVLVFLLSPINR